MTQETSVANRVLTGLEGQCENGTGSVAEKKNFGMDDSMERGDNLDIDFSMNESQDQSIIQEHDHCEAMEIKEPVSLLKQEQLTESQEEPKREIEVLNFSRQEPIVNQKAEPHSNTIEPVPVNNQILDDIAAIEESVKAEQPSRANNLEFKDIVESYGFVEDLINGEIDYSDSDIACGKKLLCLKDKDEKGFTVHSFAPEGEKRTVKCYLAGRNETSAIVGLHMMDDLEENFSVLLCIVRSDRVTVVPYKITDNLHVSLYQCEFGLESIPKKVFINKNWSCMANDKNNQRMRLLCLDTSASRAITPDGRHYPKAALSSQLVDLESSSELLEVDISPVDGLLLVTYSSGVKVKDFTGKQSKLSLHPHQREEVVFAKFMGSDRQGASEYLLCLETGQGHIFQIEDRSVGNFRVAHCQTFSTGAGLGGPKDVRLYSEDIFLSNEYLIILFREDFYFVAFCLEKEAVSGRPAVSAMAKFNHKLQEKDQTIRFSQTDQGKQLPLCFSKNFSNRKLVYKLQGLLDRGCYTEKTKEGASVAEQSSICQVETIDRGAAKLDAGREGAIPATEDSSGDKIAKTASQRDSPVNSDRLENDGKTDVDAGNSRRPDVSESKPEQAVQSVENLGREQEPTDDQEGPVEQDAEGEITAVEEDNGQARERESESDEEPEEDDPQEKSVDKPEVKSQTEEIDESNLTNHDSVPPVQVVRRLSHAANHVDHAEDKPAVNVEDTPVDRQANYSLLSYDQQAESFLKEQLFSSLNETQNIREVSRDACSELIDSKPSPEEAMKPRAFDNFLEKELFIDTFKQKNDTQSEFVPTTVPELKAAKRSDGHHKTHSATPENHAAQKKAENQKSNQQKKNDKNDYKKKATKGKKDRESETVPQSKKYTAQDKGRTDKYDDFVPKENVYKEKDAKEKERNKGSTSPAGPIGPVSPKDNFYYKTDYVPKSKDSQKSATADVFIPKQSQKDETKISDSVKISATQESMAEKSIDLVKLNAEIGGVFNKYIKEAVSELQSTAHSVVFDADKIQALIVGIVDKYVDERLIKTLKDNFNCIMSNNYNEAFEDLVVPCFEKYLMKVFDKTNNTFERGIKYFCDKLLIEEKKVNHIKEQMTLMTNQFSAQMKNAAKVSQDLGQLSKEVVSTQHKELTKRVTNLEEQVDKLNEKSDKMLDYMERLLARMEEKEQDKKVELPPPSNNSAVLEQIVELMRSNPSLHHAPAPATFSHYAHPPVSYMHQHGDPGPYRQHPHSFAPSTPPLHYSIASGPPQNQYVMTPPSSTSYSQPQSGQYIRSGTSTPQVVGDGYQLPRPDAHESTETRVLQRLAEMMAARHDDRHN